MTRIEELAAKMRMSIEDAERILDHHDRVFDAVIALLDASHAPHNMAVGVCMDVVDELLMTLPKAERLRLWDAVLKSVETIAAHVQGEVCPDCGEIHYGRGDHAH